MVRRFLMLLAVCLVLGSVGVQAFGQDAAAPITPAPGVTAPEAVKLEYKYTPGELLRYKVIMNMDVHVKMDMPGAEDSKGATQIPNMSMQMVMVMRQRTKKLLPNGDAEVTTAFESMKVTDPKGKSMAMSGAKIPTFTAVMGKNGMVKSIQGLEKLQRSMHGMKGTPGMDPSSISQMMGRYAAFPDTPLKVGESWTSSISLPMGVNFNVDSQLERLDTKAGNMTAALKQDFTGDLNYKMQIPAKSGQQAGTAASVETTGNISGIAKVNFLVNKGRVLSSTGNIGMHMNVNCVPQGDNAQSGTMAMDMAMTMEMFQLPSASLR